MNQQIRKNTSTRTVFNNKCAFRNLKTKNKYISLQNVLRGDIGLCA